MQQVRDGVDKIVAAYDTRAAEAQTCLNCQWMEKNQVMQNRVRYDCIWPKSRLPQAMRFYGMWSIDSLAPFRSCPTWEAAADRARREGGGAE